MNKRNEGKQGYKQTKVGWIPKEWDLVKLKTACLNSGQYGVNASAISFDPKLPRYIRITDISEDGNLNNDNPKSLGKTLAKGYSLNNGDFLFARTGATVGKTHLHGDHDKDFVFAGYLIRFIPDPAKMLVEYLKAYVSSSKYWQWVKEITRAGAQPNINATEYASLLIPLPPLAEQKKIAEILSSWDRAIVQIGKLIEAKKKLKKGLMQQLLTGRKRFPEFGKPGNGRLPKGWLELKANELFQNQTKKKYGSQPVLSVTQDQGIVLRALLERKINMSADNTDSYKLVEPGQFVISLRSFQGGLEYSSMRGIVSPAYHVIKPIKQIDNDFYRYFFKSYLFIGHLAVAVIGIRDGKQISFSDFSFLKIPYPPVEEQKYIANMLKALDKEIINLSEKKKIFKKQKKALMQKLLTGKIRVNASSKNPSVEEVKA